jgi:hypothetical protein
MSVCIWDRRRDRLASQKRWTTSAPNVNPAYRTYKSVTAKFWPRLSGKIPQNVLSCSLFDRKRDQLTSQRCWSEEGRTRGKKVKAIIWPWLSHMFHARFHPAWYLNEILGRQNRLTSQKRWTTSAPNVNPAPRFDWLNPCSRRHQSVTLLITENWIF